MAATVTKSGMFAIVDGSAEDVVNYLNNLGYMPKIQGMNRTILGDTCSIIIINANGNI